VLYNATLDSVNSSNSNIAVFKKMLAINLDKGDIDIGHAGILLEQALVGSTIVRSHQDSSLAWRTHRVIGYHVLGSAERQN
jgi:hypothetical protein